MVPDPLNRYVVLYNKKHDVTMNRTGSRTVLPEGDYVNKRSFYVVLSTSHEVSPNTSSYFSQRWYFFSNFTFKFDSLLIFRSLILCHPLGTVTVTAKDTGAAIAANTFGKS